MDTTWKTSIWQQFGAAIDMLDNAVRACPDELWNERLWDDRSAPPELSAFWYVTYHALVGSVRFTAQGAPRAVYFAVLISHTILAAATPPLVLRTLYLGLKRRDDRHRRIARWTLPIWLYVSVTGVVVYVMLYHLYPSGAFR